MIGQKYPFFQYFTVGPGACADVSPRPILAQFVRQNSQNANTTFWYLSRLSETKWCHALTSAARVGMLALKGLGMVQSSRKRGFRITVRPDQPLLRPGLQLKRLVTPAIAKPVIALRFRVDGLHTVSSHSTDSPESA